jgi:hypothetical protein
MTPRSAVKSAGDKLLILSSRNTEEDKMPSENLPLQHHQQDTDYYCGAACAQMVLEAISAGILDQDDLYADNHSHSTLDSSVDWFTAPDGLEWTLNDRRPSSFKNYFALCA